MLASTSLPDSTLPVVVTTGEPAGIGPELILMLAAQGQLPEHTVAIGDPEMLRQRATQLGLDVTITVGAPGERHRATQGLSVWPVALSAPATPGALNPANADYVLATLSLAVDACQKGQAAAMVTPHVVPRRWRASSPPPRHRRHRATTRCDR